MTWPALTGGLHLQVLLDLFHRLGAFKMDKFKVVFIDTYHLFPETYKFLAECEVRCQMYRLPQLTPLIQSKLHIQHISELFWPHTSLITSQFEVISENSRLISFFFFPKYVPIQGLLLIPIRPSSPNVPPSKCTTIQLLTGKQQSNISRTVAIQGL